MRSVFIVPPSMGHKFLDFQSHLETKRNYYIFSIHFHVVTLVVKISKLPLNLHTYFNVVRTRGMLTPEYRCQPAQMWPTSELHMTVDQLRRVMVAGTCSFGTDNIWQKGSWQMSAEMARDARVHALRHTTKWIKYTQPIGTSKCTEF